MKNYRLKIIPQERGMTTGVLLLLWPGPIIIATPRVPTAAIVRGGGVATHDGGGCGGGITGSRGRRGGRR